MIKIDGQSLIGDLSPHRHATARKCHFRCVAGVAVWRGGVAKKCGMLTQQAPQSHHTKNRPPHLWQCCGAGVATNKY